MNPQHSSGRVTGIILVTLLTVGGLAAGLFWPGGTPSEPDDGETASPELNAGGAALPTLTAAAAPLDAELIQFPLSDWDRRDQIQAPALASDGGQRIWLAWETQTGPVERTLMLTASTDGGRTFATPRSLRTAPIFSWDVTVRGQTSKRSSRMWPRLAFARDTLFVSWVDSSPADVSTLVLRCATSRDGGESFSEPVQLSSPHAVRPTFVDMTADATGRVVASWLDNRAEVQQVYSATAVGNDVLEKLVFSGPDGQGVCPCCTTAVWADRNGEVLCAFRNNHNGFRDTWIARQSNSQADFEPPRPTTVDRWRFDGCPHDGPMVTRTPAGQHVTFMDAHSGTQQVYLGFLKTDSEQFEVQPIHQAMDRSQGHATLLADHTGRLHLAWDESLDVELPADHGQAETEAGGGGHRHGPPVGSGRVIRYATSADGGQSLSPPVTLHLSPGAFQTRPMLCPIGELGVMVAWVELSAAGKQLVAMRLTAEYDRLAARE